MGAVLWRGVNQPRPGRAGDPKRAAGPHGVWLHPAGCRGWGVFRRLEGSLRLHSLGLKVEACVGEMRPRGDYLAPFRSAEFFSESPAFSMSVPRPLVVLHAATQSTTAIRTAHLI